MGKGDKKTKRGKIFRGSYGARRPGKINKTIASKALVLENVEAVKEEKVPAAQKKIKSTDAH